MTHHAFSTPIAPTTLQGWGVRLDPLQAEHTPLLEQAAADGELWTLRFAGVPAPGQAEQYVRVALDGLQQGHMLPFLVRDLTSGQAVGTTRYYHIDPSVARLDIGYTWYAKRMQRSHVNTACKLLLLDHAFNTLGAAAVGWRTDNLNVASQQAIARLGAQFEGRMRHHILRRDGTVRDTMLYSLLAQEWPSSRARLLERLAQYGHAA
ncbi:MAG TPA: GNAT family protein [Alcaligenes faecalis]|nr:GNAT family protein [Alcaligenes faecalis]